MASILGKIIRGRIRVVGSNFGVDLLLKEEVISRLVSILITFAEDGS